MRATQCSLYAEFDRPWNAGHDRLYMLVSPVTADQIAAKIRVKNREPVPSYRMDRNDDELDAIMVSGPLSDST